MKPFDSYPHGGHRLLGIAKGANCRHEYGLLFMRICGQTRRAYCDADFAASYETWLNMVLDHVIPQSVCNEWGISEHWRDDYTNNVLACSACNSFRNRYKPSVDLPIPDTLEAFHALRDTIFAERKRLIAARHEEERAFFDSRPWESSG
jgi:hypothetical protein